MVLTQFPQHSLSFSELARQRSRGITGDLGQERGTVPVLCGWDGMGTPSHDAILEESGGFMGFQWISWDDTGV